MRFLFAGQLRALSVSGPYRADGTEIVYSPERILALGMREFEFERDWPPALEFIGPLTGAPPFPFTAPEFVAGKKHILISLGTHLNWVKQRAAKLIKTIAPQMPDCVFHFTFGQPGSLAHERPANLHFHGYIPYDQFLDNYDAAIIHGGTGVLYSCIKAGVPMLVWPQDFDHFDHAARIVSRRLGFRLRPRPGELISDLRAILNDDAIQSSVRHFQLLANDYDAGKWALHALKDLRQ